jgi:hypothetical protein
MDHCATCEGLSERFNIITPDEYQDIARQLIGMVNRSSLELVQADCPLEDIVRRVWVGDSVSHYLKCATCGQGFLLSADTYHGGARWRPYDLPKSN